MDYQRWAEEFASIGREMTSQKTLEQLLTTILTELRRLTASDAGTIYRVKEFDDDRKLQFELAQNDSINLPDSDSVTLEIDKSSVAGYVALTGEVVNLEDVKDLPEAAPYSCDTSFDEETGYETVSMLVVPLSNREGEVKGVLQLINRKQDSALPASETEILTYPQEMAQLVRSFASQAAVALERSALEESIQQMLESIIQALVSATDNRDKTTSGHSQRLALYARELAREIDQNESERWADVSMDSAERETLYYAGLLHDIGKLAVPEAILNKENRLSQECMQAVKYRLAYMEATDQVDDMEKLYSILDKVNQASFIREEEEEKLTKLSEITFENPVGEVKHLLSNEELKNLSVVRGNLTEEERATMEKHPEVTHEILKQVNWTKGLEEVPRQAALHHEKLNGEGYPWGLEGEEIPLPARILAVLDIYEALTAPDRAYKDPMAPERAREILEEDAAAGALDPAIVELFFESGIYERVSAEEIETPSPADALPQ